MDLKYEADGVFLDMVVLCGEVLVGTPLRVETIGCQQTSSGTLRERERHCACSLVFYGILEVSLLTGEELPEESTILEH